MLSYYHRCQGKEAAGAPPPQMKVCHLQGSEEGWEVGYGPMFTAGKEGSGMEGEREMYYTLFSACHS